MKLRYFKAERFRSLRDFEVQVDDFMVLTGENNCGKSNVFLALDLFLSSSVRGLSAETFFNHHTQTPIVLTARFEELSDAETEKLGPWTVDGALTVSKEYSLEESGKADATYYALMRVPEQPWLADDFADYGKRDVVSKLPIAEFLPESGRITKEAYGVAVSSYITAHPESVEFRTERRKNPAGYKAVLDGYMPQLHLVPAVREVTEETKTTPSALLGRLVNVVVSRIARFNPAFQDLEEAIQGVRNVIEGETPGEKMAEITELEDQIQKALMVWEVDVSIRVEPPDLGRLFQLGTNVMLDDGLETGIESKGHGLQRSLIFALMRVWAGETRRRDAAEPASARERSNIFAFEEPELFLHPQVCRATYEALKSISDTEQVLLCTHSSHFVNLEDYRHLAMVRKPSQEEGTNALRVTSDLFEADEERKQRFNMIRFFNPDRNEVFFARKAALLEGGSEKSVIPVVGRRLGVFDHSVSLVDCAGKFNLTLYMKVLNAFRIPYLVIYDEDPIPEDVKPGSPGHDADKYQEAKHGFDENHRIESECDAEFASTRMVAGELESILGVSKSRGEKVGKPYAAVEHYSDEANPIPAEVEDLVREIYALPV